jgi:hypothetical protein
MANRREEVNMSILVTATIILGIWGALGPIVGIYLGAHIANRNQRKQWLSDCKKEEYSSLLSAVTEASVICATLPLVQGPEEQSAAAAARKRVGEVAFSKIFIASAIKRLRVTQRWEDAVRSGNKSETFADTTGQLMDDIRAEAIKDISGDL